MPSEKEMSPQPRKKTKEQLIEELLVLQQRCSEFESLESERTKAVEALQESEERFRRMADNIQDGLTIVENHKTVYVNERMCEISGYEKEDLLSQGSMGMLTPESRKEFQNIFDTFQRTGIIPKESEYEIVRKDGMRRNIYSRHSVCRKGDKILGYYDILTYVTERKRVEKALQKSQQQLRGIIDNSISAISVKDSSGYYVFFNKEFEREFGLHNNKIIGETDFDFFPVSEAKKFFLQEQKVLETGKPLKSEEVISCNGTRKTFLITRFPLFDSEKKTYAVCALSTDITQRKLAEEKLKTLNQQLE
ncbi:MAG: PAS domain-containing protein, partial [SAR324 cluster bacterium]|nr:PAS domain-containing protein [SAR324 cluster bacterium]